MSALRVDLAEEWVSRGCRMFPIIPGQKRPRFKGWQEWATRDAEKIRAHLTAHPDDNTAAATGDGINVLDVDGEAGAQSLAALEAVHGPLPETCRVRTASGGEHIYLTGPDVSNSVGKLGAGLDFRSRGGYAVAPGSRTEAGEYVVEHAADFAPMPQWLVDLCGAPRVKENTGAPVPDAQPDAFERAREWLAMQEPAIEGAGGDAHTLATAYGLRDMGVSQAQCVELLAGEWNERCAPPWTLAELETKARNAYAYAQSAAGTKAVSAADFAVVVDAAPVAQPAPVAQAVAGAFPRLRRARALATLNPGPALWEGVVPEGGIFAIGALPGRSKSYTATGLLYALATDAGGYLGRCIPTGTAGVYVDVERISTTELRIAVWALADGRDPEGIPLFLAEGLRLNAPRTVDALIEAIRAADLGGRRLSLIIIDSLGAALPGAEMNSSAGATTTGDQLRKIARELRCAVGVVAHSPKSGEETVAGSLHFDAIFDTAIFVRSEDGATGSLYVKKDNGLALEEHERLTHWRRETLTERSGEREVRVHRLVAGPPPAAGANKAGRLTGNARRIWEVLCRLRPDNSPIPDGEWRAHCAEFLGARRAAWTDARRALEDAGLIARTGDLDAKGAAILWKRAMVGPE